MTSYTTEEKIAPCQLQHHHRAVVSNPDLAGSSRVSSTGKVFLLDYFRDDFIQSFFF